MLVACYAISRLQEGAYQRFRDSYPAEYRSKVYRAKWLHRAGKAGIGVLILFYFVPTAFWVIGIRAVVTGLIYGILSLALVLVLGFVTRTYYKRHLGEAPPDSEEEVTVVRKIISPARPPEA